MTHKGQEHVNHVNYSRDVNINRSKQAQYRTILAVVTNPHVNKSDIFYLIFVFCRFLSQCGKIFNSSATNFCQ